MEHQRLCWRIMRLEYLRHQEIHNVTVRPAKCAHKSVAVGGRLQRECSEIEPSRPSFRLPQQAFDIFGCEIEPEASVQECVRFLVGKSQIGGS